MIDSSRIQFLGALLATLAVPTLMFGACSSDERPATNASFGGSGNAGSGAGGSTSGGAGAGDSGTDASTGGSSGSGVGGSGGTTGGTGGSGLDAGGDADTGAGDGAVPEHCSNQTRDEDETDEDCGGSCAPCGPTQRCTQATDCESLVCTAATLVCAAPTCTDEVRNGNETDTDCGGQVCNKCPADGRCVDADDCESSVCLNDICQAATCTDGVWNGSESDEDCGAVCTQKCRQGRRCSQAADCTSNICTGGQCACPENMIVAPIQGGGSYCIDKWEVWNEEYQAFINSGTPPADQAAECLWNDNFVPTGNWPWDTDDNKKPVTHVDWCDAKKYCESVGKRLCGGVSGGGAPVAAATDQAQNQWFNACSAQGSNAYPYGNGLYDPARCNTPGVPPVSDASAPDRKNSTSLPNSCIGGQSGLFDMSGNLAEWTDSCDAASGQSDSCQVRGGSYATTTPAGVACAAVELQDRSFKNEFIGFRCCLH